MSLQDNSLNHSLNTRKVTKLWISNKTKAVALGLILHLYHTGRVAENQKVSKSLQLASADV